MTLRRRYRALKLRALIWVLRLAGATGVQVSDAPSREELGLGKREAARADKLAELGAEEREKLISKLKAEGNKRPRSHTEPPRKTLHRMK